MGPWFSLIEEYNTIVAKLLLP